MRELPVRVRARLPPELVILDFLPSNSSISGFGLLSESDLCRIKTEYV